MDIRRRNFWLWVFGLPLGFISVLGIFNTLTIDAKFEHTPPNPTIGEQVVFDATESNGNRFTWYIDGKRQEGGVIGPGSNPEDARITYEFNTSGAHVVTLELEKGQPFANDRISKTIYVAENEVSANAETLINTATEVASIQLRGTNKRIKLQESAGLEFSGVNLSNQNLSINLVLKVPSGLSVRGTSFVESGIGQYSASFSPAPSETVGTSIRVEPTRTGEFEIEGIAEYTTPDGNKTRHQGTFSLIVTDA